VYELSTCQAFCNIKHNKGLIHNFLFNTSQITRNNLAAFSSLCHSSSGGGAHVYRCPTILSMWDNVAHLYVSGATKGSSLQVVFES
jgi:hypothetical protein